MKLSAAAAALLFAATPSVANASRLLVAFREGEFPTRVCPPAAESVQGTVVAIFQFLRGCEIESPLSAPTALEILETNEDILSVDESQNYTAFQPPGLYNLDRINQPALPLDGVPANIDASGVRVYILDTGVSGDHTEFAGHLDASSSCHFDATPEGDALVDNVGHGTHVAGTACGNTYGVATNCEVCAVKVLLPFFGGLSSWIAAGINHAVANCALDGATCVINMSLGGPASPTMNALVANAVDAGIVVVAAAGNDDNNSCGVSPASEPKVITVGAIGETDAIAPFSNFGPCNDVYAPGVDILSSYIPTTTSSQLLDGTSMAAPHVAACAAGILSNDPTLDPAAVAAKISGDAVTIGQGPLGQDIDLIQCGSVGTAPPTPSNTLSGAPTPLPTLSPTLDPDDIKFNETLSAEVVVETLFEDDVEVRNVTASAHDCFRLFYDGDRAGNDLATGAQLLPTEGIMISSGKPQDFVDNNLPGNTFDFQAPGDAEVEALFNLGINPSLDACVVEFEFRCGSGASSDISFNYMFGSDEYIEYVDSNFNDVFALILNGDNIALLPGTSTPVSINNVNHLQNTAYFIQNDPNAGGVQYPRIEADGFTTILPATGTTLADPTAWNKLKLVVADVGDGAFDSWTLLEAGSFTCDTNAPTISPTPDCPVEYESCTLGEECCGGAVCTQVDAGGLGLCLRPEPCVCDEACLAQFSTCDLGSPDDICCDGTACTRVDASGAGVCMEATTCNQVPPPTPPPAAAGDCPGGYWSDYETNTCKCDCPVALGPGCKPAPPPIAMYNSIEMCCATGLSWIDPLYCNTRSTGTFSGGWVVDWQSETCVKDCDPAEGHPCQAIASSDEIYTSIMDCCARIGWNSNCVAESQ